MGHLGGVGLSASSSSGGSGDWTRETLAEKVCEILREELLEVDDGFGPSSNLVESGLDSLAVTQLMLSLEESTGIWLDESLLTPEVLETADTLAACLLEELSRG